VLCCVREATCRGSPATPCLHTQRLFHAIYSPGFVYTVHVDSKSEEDLLDGIARFLDRYPNAHRIPSVRCVI
jgi:hypothetical protein